MRLDPRESFSGVRCFECQVLLKWTLMQLIKTGETPDLFLSVLQLLRHVISTELCVTSLCVAGVGSSQEPALCGAHL